ncbi:MAG TPA: hypothetical protein VEU11_07645 [Terriglobales bacterium]|jgi:hypothetical protein|nr:hypothetical protein [Terriglobales bacterium]
MKPLITALLLLGAGSAWAQTLDLPDATPDVAVAAKRPQPLFNKFNKKIFWIEAGAYTLSNVLDGYTTVAQMPGYEESGFPRGSSFLLGKHPTAARYAATMGIIQIATTFAAYRLEHSQKKFLRIFGHALMIQGIYAHTDGFIGNIRLQGSDSNPSAPKRAPAATPLLNLRF